MPWLIKDESHFVHIPRSGGTSLANLHRTKHQACKGQSFYHKIGLYYFYYRYKMLEYANFPVITIENLVATMQIIGATLIFIYAVHSPFPAMMWSSATLTFIVSTFIATASAQRFQFFRAPNMFLFGKIMFGFGSDKRFVTGVNWDGWLVHFTAAKAIRYGYVSKPDMSEKSFSIVRNPYSRMVSLYQFNKRPWESFDSFVRSLCHDTQTKYWDKGIDDCHYIYCHALPMVAYTHTWTKDGPGQQLVTCTLRLEQLSKMLASDNMGTEFGVPEFVQKTIKGMPHRNRRKRKSPWADMYTNATAQLVYDTFFHDFQTFSYDAPVPGRPDLDVPTRERVESKTSINTSTSSSIDVAGDAGGGRDGPTTSDEDDDDEEEVKTSDDDIDDEDEKKKKRRAESETSVTAARQGQRAVESDLVSHHSQSSRTSFSSSRSAVLPLDSEGGVESKYRVANV